MRVREVAVNVLVAVAVAEEVPKIVEVEVEVLVVAAGSDGRPDGRPLGDQVCWEVLFLAKSFLAKSILAKILFCFDFVILYWNITERFVSSERKVPGVECQLQVTLCVVALTIYLRPGGLGCPM